MSYEPSLITYLSIFYLKQKRKAKQRSCLFRFERNDDAHIYNANKDNSLFLKFRVARPTQIFKLSNLIRKLML